MRRRPHRHPQPSSAQPPPHSSTHQQNVTATQKHVSTQLTARPHPREPHPSHPRTPHRSCRVHPTNPPHHRPILRPKAWPLVAGLKRGARERTPRSRRATSRSPKGCSRHPTSHFTTSTHLGRIVSSSHSPQRTDSSTTRRHRSPHRLRRFDSRLQPVPHGPRSVFARRGSRRTPRQPRASSPPSRPRAPLDPSIASSRSI